jgi:hypothetical protein
VSRPTTAHRLHPVGQVDALNDIIDIFATFKQRLTFIGGMIESHRAGTGKRTRIMTRRDIDGTYYWDVLDNPGLDRANLVFQYGGLVQGFRVVPFGNFGTTVYAIGRVLNETLPHYIKQAAPGISEATYGKLPQINSGRTSPTPTTRPASEAAARRWQGRQAGRARAAGRLAGRQGRLGHHRLGRRRHRAGCRRHDPDGQRLLDDLGLELAPLPGRPRRADAVAPAP